MLLGMPMPGTDVNRAFDADRLGALLANAQNHVPGVLSERWRALRRAPSLAWTNEVDGPGFWSVTRYADALAILRDNEHFSCENGTLLEADRSRPNPAGGFMLALSDPPHHTMLRAALAPCFAPASLRRLEDPIRAVARRLLAARADGRPFDVVAALATPLAVEALLLLLELQTDRTELARLTVAMSDPDPHVQADAMRSLLALSAEMLAETAAAGNGGEIITALSSVQTNGAPLSAMEIELNLFNLLSAGVDTTRLAVATAICALAANPDQLKLLAADSRRAKAATEEVLRWGPPAAHFLRTVVQEVVVRETDLAVGEQVVAWLGSVNRDEEAFEEPDRFRILREPNRHLTFGSGIHTCIGAALARLELRVLLEELAVSVRSIEVIAPVEYVHSVMTAGPARVETVLELRT